MACMGEVFMFMLCVHVMGREGVRGGIKKGGWIKDMLREGKSKERGKEQGERERERERERVSSLILYRQWYNCIQNTMFLIATLCVDNIPGHCLHSVCGSGLVEGTNPLPTLLYTAM